MTASRPVAGAATAGSQAPAPGRSPRAVVDLMRRLEGEERIDRAVRRLRSVADTVVPSDGVADGLRGTWLGHALHPLLTDFPLGTWMSASFLDLLGGPEARRPAQRLVGFGLVVAVPTAATGLAEWQALDGAGSKRVGVVHATVNTTATVLYGSSWLARRRGAHRLAVGLGVGGGVVATVGGYVGGHLSLVRKIGTADPAFGLEPGAEPADEGPHER